MRHACTQAVQAQKRMLTNWNKVFIPSIAEDSNDLDKRRA